MPIWKEQEQSKFFSAFFFIFYIWFEISDVFLTEYVRRIHVLFIMRNLGWRVSESCFLLKNYVYFNDMNLLSLTDDRQIEIGGTQLFLTWMNFWPLKVFHEVSANELTYWLEICLRFLGKILKYILLQTSIVVLSAKSALLFSQFVIYF